MLRPPPNIIARWQVTDGVPQYMFTGGWPAEPNSSSRHGHSRIAQSTNGDEMELAANVWPVLDESTGIVQRYFMRAYAFKAPDDVIGATLRSLAPTDYCLAQVFPVPARFHVSSQYGTLQGAVTIGDFHEYQEIILENALRSLEKVPAPFHGVDASGEQPRGVVAQPAFPREPYLVVTVILESAAGDLRPHLGQ